MSVDIKLATFLVVAIKFRPSSHIRTVGDMQTTTPENFLGPNLIIAPQTSTAVTGTFLISLLFEFHSD